MAGCVLYNPLAGNGKGEEDARLLEVILQEDLLFYDMTRITNYAAFLSGMEPGDYLIIAGGDGTLKNTGKRVDKKVGRNDPCPCGSGRKYKHCCGK